jgi:hypothetical protein
MEALMTAGMQALRTTAIGRNLGEAYDYLIKDQGCTFPEVSRFEVISARRISTQFRISNELATEAFDGQHTVEVWEFEVFGHVD